ncbi:MAG: IMP dehydrogenase [Candidatus Riflemargulisbacteria bacterium]
MTYIYEEVSRTFNEYLLVPNLTTKDCTPDKINLHTPLVRYKKGTEPELKLNIPFVSAIMQSVSNDSMAIALSRCGGLSFIYQSQDIISQAAMVKKVKKYKAGFVISTTNLKPDDSLADVLELNKQTGHSTMPVTEDGSPTGKLMGIVTSKDYRISRDSLDKKVADFMTPINKLIFGTKGIALNIANDLLWEHKLNCLPIVNDKGYLRNLVFRKDYDEHKEHPFELLDNEKRLIVGAGINTKDFKERVPALLEAGADVLCIDSSDGYSVWQKETIEYIKSNFGDCAKVGAGNIVDREGFLYLAEAGADFVKVGIGGGSICITREQKGIGRGQATAIIEVAKARDEYYERTGIYIPICSDGGIVHDYHTVLALAMGADFIMMGRYFARFDESPNKTIRLGKNYVKEYWGEGSNRAKNWERYELGEKNGHLKFEEGVDSYVPYAGKLKDTLDITLAKIKSTMCSCGAKTIEELKRTARLTPVSATSIIEGGAHDVILKDKEYT